MRRSQAVLAAQRYSKQAGAVPPEGRIGRRRSGRGLRRLFRAEAPGEAGARRRGEPARVDVGRARVLLANVEKDSWITQRRLGIAVHQCRLLVPRDMGPAPISRPGPSPSTWPARNGRPPAGPGFPLFARKAVERARRNRLEVRLMVVGTRIAQLQNKRDKLRLFGIGLFPLTWPSRSRRRTTAAPPLG